MPAFLDQAIETHCTACVYHLPKLLPQAISGDDRAMLQARTCAFKSSPGQRRLPGKPQVQLQPGRSRKVGVLTAAAALPSDPGELHETHPASSGHPHAARRQTRLAGMHLVGDGFISLIVWQPQGNKLVPLF